MKYKMNDNKNNGVIYYKLDENYKGDLTKNCGLTGGEIDSNFFFLRGYDIESVEWDKNNGALIFNRINGETISVYGINEIFSVDESYYDANSGTLVLNINNRSYPISGFFVKDDVSVYTGNSINGDGTVEKPLDVKQTLKTGFFAPIKHFIDKTGLNNYINQDYNEGDRILTKEILNDNIVYFLNYWDGYTWDKLLLNNNATFIINDGPDGTINNIWQLFNGELFNYSQNISSSTQEYTDNKIDLLSKKHIDDINKIENDFSKKIDEVQNKINSDVDVVKKLINDETNRSVEVENKINEKINKEIDDREKDVLTLTNAIKKEESNVVEINKNITNIYDKIIEINNKVENNDANILTRGEFISLNVIQDSGKIVSLAIEEKDIASETELNKLKEKIDAFLDIENISGDTIDTLTEIQDYIKSDVSAAAAMTLNIENIQKKVDTLESNVNDEFIYTNKKVATIEKDYLTSLDKSELISYNTETNNKISKVEENYKLADSELNKRIDVIEDGYALKSDVKTEIERAKGEERRIETLVESKLEISTFNEKVIEINNKIANLTEKDENIDNEILDIKNDYVLKTTFDSEVVRAENAEKTLSTKIESEYERALTKETAIEKLISNETVRAEEKEGELSDSIVNLKTLIGEDKVSTQISNALGILDFSDVAQNEMFVSEVQQKNGKISKIGRLPFSGVTYIKDIRDEVDILKNDITEKAPISSVYTKDETNSTFVNKSQIVNTLGGSENLVVSQKKINEEIDRLRSEIISSGSGGEVDLTTVYERLQKIETDIANINTLIDSNKKELEELTKTMNDEISVRSANDDEHNKQISELIENLNTIDEVTSNTFDEINSKLGSGTIITTDNIKEYIVTPSDDENIVISKIENGGISIKLVKIDNMNF